MALLNEFLRKDIKHRNDYELTPTGDLVLEDGLDNLRAALFRRLVTSPGSLVHRPFYGVGIKDFQNAPATIETKRKMANRIADNFQREDRIEAVKGVQIQFADDTPEIQVVKVRVEVRGFGEQVFLFQPLNSSARFDD